MLVTKQSRWLILVIFLFSVSVWAESPPPNPRYFLVGDGWITLKNDKSGRQKKVRYLKEDGSFDEKGLQEIYRLFNISRKEKEATISKRLISLLDHLEDHFKSSAIGITSGYRSPEYNEGLRDQGAKAARTSLHIEGMAADMYVAGVSGKSLWNYTRGLDCCGAGYYNGKGIHIDTGPARFWTQTTTKVETDISTRNKRILLRTEYDVYHPGETVRLSLTRITDYPIGVSPQALLTFKGKKLGELALSPNPTEKCLEIAGRKEAKSLKVTLPMSLKKTGPYQIELTFCRRPFEEMPTRLASNPIVIP